MRDRQCRADVHTGKQRSVRRRFARPALIFEFVSFFRGHGGYRHLIEGIVRVFMYDGKDIGRASCQTIPATVASLSIDRDEIASRTIAVSVLCQHDFSP